MRCFRCQRFGHTRTYCKGRPTCSKCASTDHSDESCDSDTLRCVNCGEGQAPHASYDRSCPKYVEEKEINAIKSTRNISFREAREVYQQTQPKTSYAEKVKAHTQATSLNEMSAAQLVLLLKSFGLTVVAAGTSAAGQAPPAPSDVTAPAAQTAESVSAASEPASHGGVEGNQGWTLVQPRQRGARRSPPPARPCPPPTVDEAGEMRRGGHGRPNGRALPKRSRRPGAPRELTRPRPARAGAPRPPLRRPRWRIHQAWVRRQLLHSRNGGQHRRCRPRPLCRDHIRLPPHC